MHISNSLQSLEQSFASGLANMLDKHQGLGVYILVLANAANDKVLWSGLRDILANRHAILASSMTEKLRKNDTLGEPDDDVMVFLKLMAIGFEHVQIVQNRKLGNWQLSFNPIRALRPPRNSGMKFENLYRPFDANGFHFNKPFLAKEILWEGMLEDKQARILYNKFPFARLHGLLVPEPEKNLPQFLSPELHGWAWDICALSNIPGFCLGYNSYGAGASVNHLHFQSFVADTPLPAQLPEFKHNGGAQTYPLPCLRFENREEAWLKLDEMHTRNQPYNLIYAKGAAHLIIRIPQGSARIPARSQSWGWPEMAGSINLFNRMEYDDQQADTLETELATFAP